MQVCVKLQAKQMQGQEKTKKSQQNSIIILPINKTQKYAWGYKDKNCRVGLMSKQILESYAQFWMGTHPTGESRITDQLSLKEYLAINEMDELQFLFKILSIEKCLSIQVHPNQQEAKYLNQCFPTVYVDDKDKPEMFLTLSDKFQLFLGFIQQDQFSNLIQKQPFKALSQDIPQTQYKQKIIWILQKIVDLHQKELEKYTDILFKNINNYSEQRQQILERLFKQFGYDTGLLVSCLLQHHILQMGSCFGIHAGVPHAYIKGQCFQLMKSSDNVVRLGLTPKQKDIPNLLKIVKNNFHKSYCKVQPINQHQMQKFQWNSMTIIRVFLNQQIKSCKILSNSIGIILQGNALLKNSSSQSQFQQIPQKTVFFIQKGIYLFKGTGEIVFAFKI